MPTTEKPSSHVDGIAHWPEKRSLSFADKLVEKEEQVAYATWAVTGDCNPAFAHLLPRRGEMLSPPIAAVGDNAATPPVQQKPVALQKELLVNTAVDDAPKTPALTDCPDPLVPVQKYKAYFRVESQRYKSGQRPPPLTFKATMQTEWLESYLLSGCHKKADGSKWTFEEIDDEQLFIMYESRRKKVEPKRPSTFLREKKLRWATRTLCLNAADKLITSTHRAFRDRSEFAGQL